MARNQRAMLTALGSRQFRSEEHAHAPYGTQAPTLTRNVSEESRKSSRHSPIR